MKIQNLPLKWLIAGLLPLLALALALVLYANRPRSQKSPPQRLVPLVKTVTPAPRSESVVIEAFGSVVPSRQVEIMAQVEGTVIAAHPSLVPGGIIRAGEVIVRLDPLDYELQVRERQAEVAEARYQLELEEGRQVVAEREWQLFAEEGGPMPPSKRLALREPHLENARARLDAALSRLTAAEADLARTVLQAPFNALVLKQSAEIGQLISRQSPVATLVDIDQFRVQVALPIAMLPRIVLADQAGRGGSKARIIPESSGKNAPLSWSGRVFKLLGDLDPDGRMARLLLTVDDPFRLREQGGKAGTSDKLLLESYVRVEIEAGAIENVLVIPRAALRDQDRVWILDREGKLAVRPTEILWRRPDELLVRFAWQPGEKLIVSRLQAPLPGMELRDEATVLNEGKSKK